MAASSSGRNKAFISYSHKDREYLEELHEHLAYFEKQGLIAAWDDRRLAPGVPWEAEIKQALNSARVAILLVSPSFLASDFITSKELPPLVTAARQEGTLLLSVIVRYCLFKQSVLAQFQAINDPSEPLSEMPLWKRDRVWVKVAELVADALKTAEQWMEEAYALLESERHEEALAACDRAIALDPDDAWAWFSKGYVLCGLQRYEESLAAYDRAIQLDPTYALAYHNKGWVLICLQRYQEALDALEYAIQLAPNEALAYFNKGSALHGLGRKAESEQAYKKARELGYKG